MKKMTTVILVVLLTLGLVGGAWAAAAPAAGQGQAVCPVMGGKPNPNIYADCQGQRVYFCCPACPGLFKKDAAKYLEKLKAQQAAPPQGTAGK